MRVKREQRIEHRRQLEDLRKRVMKAGWYYTSARLALNAGEITEADFLFFQADYNRLFVLWNDALVEAGY